MDINKEHKEVEQNDELWDKIQRTQNRGRLIGGIIIIAIGLLFLCREMGMYIPGWIFTWQMLLIVIGLYIGIKHAFRNFTWIVLMLVGGAFLLREFYPNIAFGQYIWPVAIILVGLALIFKPKSKHCQGRFDAAKYRRYSSRYEKSWNTAENRQGEDYVELSAVFGSVVKHIITKEFKGGEVNAVFGGVELNMTQADFDEKVELEMNAIFGGARLIIPPHWEVQSELAAVLGSVEDKRPLYKDPTGTPSRTLILRGSAVFGGIEIKSY